MAALAGRLAATTTDLAEVQVQTQQTSDTVVSEMESSFGRAVRSIDDAMQRLRGTVDGARVQLVDTTWTGSNAANFHGGYDSFTAAMGNFEAAVQDAYLQFDTQMRSVGQTITAFQTQVSASMAQAQESTASMQQAVNAQTQVLESAMNTGLSFGGS